MAGMLTDKMIKSLEVPPSGNYVVYDGPSDGIPGFGIRITSSGVRSFVLNYRFNDPAEYRKSNEWRYTIGRYGAWSLRAARDEAKKWRQRIDSGPAHPMGERRHAKKQAQLNSAAETYHEAVEDYVDRELIRRKQIASWREVKRSLLNNAQHWHSRALTTITDREALKLLENIRDGDNRQRGRASTANHVYQNMKAFFKWASKKEIGKITTSPMAEIEKPWLGEEPRDRYFEDEEIRAIWHAADKIGGVEGAYVKVDMLLGKRKTALAHMKRSELDSNGVWHPPSAARSRKKKSKNKRVHPTPLPKLALKIIDDLRMDGNFDEETDFVFPGRVKGRPLCPGSSLQAKVRANGGPEDFFYHALRHTVETRMAELGVSNEIRDAALDHVPNRGSGAEYNHYKYVNEVREAFEIWAQHIEGVVGQAWPDARAVRSAGERDATSTPRKTPTGRTSDKSEAQRPSARVREDRANPFHGDPLFGEEGRKVRAPIGVTVTTEGGNADQPATAHRGADRTSSGRARDPGKAQYRQVSPYRRRAEDLILSSLGRRPQRNEHLRAAEIVNMLQVEFGITRNQALSATTKAIDCLDPDNEARRSRKKPVARRLGQDVLAQIGALAARGFNGAQIAEQLNLQRRTVTENLSRLRRAQALAASTLGTPKAPLMEPPAPPAVLAGKFQKAAHRRRGSRDNWTRMSCSQG